jgi:hypothetical protein
MTLPFSAVSHRSFQTTAENQMIFVRLLENEANIDASSTRLTPTTEMSVTSVSFPCLVRRQILAPFWCRSFFIAPNNIIPPEPPGDH